MKRKFLIKVLKKGWEILKRIMSFLSLNQIQEVEQKITLIAISKKISRQQAQNLYHENKDKFELFFEDFPRLSTVKEKEMLNLLTKISQINLEGQKQDYFQESKNGRGKRQQSIVRKRKSPKTSHRRTKLK
ncbi:hypothetical protein [Lactococcus lactis]|uniref:hypothetical protein n=1 Tax=Lactococcus lactis TaxID=1358 RepID=UPI001F57280F|nr:hypothetical protein [Lactococcus lactis]